MLYQCYDELFPTVFMVGLPNYCANHNTVPITADCGATLLGLPTQPQAGTSMDRPAWPTNQGVWPPPLPVPCVCASSGSLRRFLCGFGRDAFVSCVSCMWTRCT